MNEAPVNETVQNIPAFFSPCGENTYIQKFDKMVDSRKFAQKMRKLCGNAVNITDDNGSVRMQIL